MSANDQTTTDTTNEQPNPSGFLGWSTHFVRFLYRNRYTGFVIDATAIGTLLFVGIIAVMMSLVAISNFFGGWHALYIGCIGTFGIYAAYRRRTASADTDTTSDEQAENVPDTTDDTDSSPSESGWSSPFNNSGSRSRSK